jgi:uncharacterized membrane protein YebE (DUF533 family)
MGLMFRRRRPVMRMATGAAVAGTAYHAGKKGQQQAEDNDQASQAAAPAAQAPAPAPSGETADLEHLASLHASGALSDEEFAAAKAKLLGI